MGRNGRQKPGGIGDIASHLQWFGGRLINPKSVVQAYQKALAKRDPSILALALERGAYLNGKDPYGIAAAILKHHENHNPYSYR
jgi:hypothetical protein